MTQNTPKIILDTPEGASNRTGLFNKVVGLIGNEGVVVLGVAATVATVLAVKTGLEKFDEMGLDTREGHYHGSAPKPPEIDYRNQMGAQAVTDTSNLVASPVVCGVDGNEVRVLSGGKEIEPHDVAYVPGSINCAVAIQDAFSGEIHTHIADVVDLGAALLMQPQGLKPIEPL